MSYRACLYGRPVPASPRLCLARDLMAGLGAATWPVASLLAPFPVIAIPTRHLPPPKTRLQVSPSSTPWRRQSAEELDGRGRSVALDQRSFRKVTWHLMPTWCLATPSWFGLKPSRILRGT
ncbi:uncharacterized protein LOC103009612 isoform X2 [Balaenoptera acutorostrata]|uniref:Uncharacterized protein LOC103009612 isoform X2 n=1 Tax=Balaenoptera acutorostrata TaxID=9767 RepID=A0A452CEI7_BALAC|nr:uncharacterized protein LOC103009612 isoform X2 [Balaenoptera acutorostrata]